MMIHDGGLNKGDDSGGPVVLVYRGGEKVADGMVTSRGVSTMGKNDEQWSGGVQGWREGGQRDDDHQGEPSPWR
ncbi:hypothetical protein L1987_40167 [Smallanthus sonchifolius]|uniref:Uncharacterized protein n=1 Tax=Smallanthus sonchifolius TaxID=185202 RepID=A0ACB9GTR8_9ASTR|nr:hypothetical protein L1987_40167 [Smallanthus sonchifolius]